MRGACTTISERFTSEEMRLSGTVTVESGTIGVEPLAATRINRERGDIVEIGGVRMENNQAVRAGVTMVATGRAARREENEPARVVKEVLMAVRVEENEVE